MPDSSAYQFDPRIQAEVSHWFTGYLRAGLGYQLDIPNFQYDPSTWFTTHKLTGELETRLRRTPPLGHERHALRSQPEPDRCRQLAQQHDARPDIHRVPLRLPLRDGVVLRGGASGASGARFLTNRDLDSSYDWSIISRFTLQPIALSFDLEWILDRYSASAGAPYAGNFGSILWGEVGYEVAAGCCAFRRGEVGEQPRADERDQQQPAK